MSLATDKHTDNILIGSGELYMDLLDGDGGPTGERYLGDGDGASLAVTTERVTVFSGTGPVARKLADKVRSLTRSLSITLHDISPENLALFAAGAVESVAEAAIAVNDEELTVKKGHWYQLGVTDDKPAGVGAIAAVASKTIVKNKTRGPVHAAGADYTVDPGHGRLYIEPGGAIADGAEIKVSYTPVAASRKQVKTGELREIRAAVRYIEDTDTGEGRNYYAPLCSVGPSGEMGLMSRDTEQQIQLSCEILDPGGGKAALVIDGEPV